MKEFFGPDLHLHGELGHVLDQFGGAARCNLEDIMIYLDLSRRRLERWDSSLKAAYGGSLSRAYDDCLSYIERRLHIPIDATDPLHLQLFQGLQQGENVITLNYDLVADQALTAAETPIGGRPPSGSRIGKMQGLLGPQMYASGSSPPGLLKHEYMGGLYIKLHGSLDWLRCSTEACPGSQQFFAQGQAPLGKEHMSFTPCRYCGGYLEAAIIPPRVGKLVDEQGKMSFLWNLAWASLKWADEWVFIGVSLAPTDYDLTWLLRAAADTSTSPRRVVIVNPDDNAGDRVRRALSPKVPPIDTFCSMAEYLASVTPTESATG